MGPYADQEPSARRPVWQRRAVRALLDISGRNKDVMEQREIDRSDQQEVLVAVLSIGIEDAYRYPQQIGQRPRQAEGAREPHDRSPLAEATEQVGASWRVRGAFDQQSGAVGHPMRMYRFATTQLRDAGERT